MRKHSIFKQTTFACFSPPVMIGTFFIEILCSVYVLWKYKMSLVTRLCVALCVNLALFQFAEYFVCTQSTYAIIASRMGYAAITLLPPLGFWLMCELSGKVYKPLVHSLMVLGAFIAVYFLLHKSAFESYECTGNYVIFQIGKAQTTLYSSYYFGLLIATIARGSYAVFSTHAHKMHAVRWLLAGYAIFIVPVAVLTTLHPNTRQAVPSILCGFAVTFAVILTTRVLPIYDKETDQA